LTLEAARAEAERPSVDSLPPSGEVIKRERTDPMTGERSIDWFGRESFMKSLNRLAHKVLRFLDRKSGKALAALDCPADPDSAVPEPPQRQERHLRGRCDPRPARRKLILTPPVASGDLSPHVRRWGGNGGALAGLAGRETLATRRG
jgi:hypothetical protein